MKNEVNFDFDNLPGNRVSKHKAHAQDPVMDARWFDMFSMQLDDSISDLRPEIPDGSMADDRSGVYAAFALGYYQCQTEVERIVREQTKNTLEAIAGEIGRGME